MPVRFEGNTFSSIGTIEEDLINIVAVHPMQEEAVEMFLAKAGADWALIDTLIAQGRLLSVVYEGKKFYLRKIEENHLPASAGRNIPGMIADSTMKLSCWLLVRDPPFSTSPLLL
jgi:hypothetical protein